MHRFIGTWAGFGTAFFPTIATTQYREMLTFSEHAGKPMLQIEQKTWRIHDDKNETLLHWEFGFMVQREDGSYQWTNCQNNGRLEILECAGVAESDHLKMSFTSTSFMNDPRMVAAGRILELNGDNLTYSLAMTTETVAEHQVHLEAHLTRTA